MKLSSELELLSWSSFIVLLVAKRLRLYWFISVSREILWSAHAACVVVSIWSTSIAGPSRTSFIDWRTLCFPIFSSILVPYFWNEIKIQVNANCWQMMRTKRQQLSMKRTWAKSITSKACSKYAEKSQMYQIKKLTASKIVQNIIKHNWFVWSLFCIPSVLDACLMTLYALKSMTSINICTTTTKDNKEADIPNHMNSLKASASIF